MINGFWPIAVSVEEEKSTRDAAKGRLQTSKQMFKN
jgi:hypothetical protein